MAFDNRLADDVEILSEAGSREFFHKFGRAAQLDLKDDRRIAVEVCLTSNVQTRATESLEAHPFPQYLKRGLNVVLNTDNRLMSGTTLTDEYELAARHLGADFDALTRVALNGFESAFLPFKERQALVERARTAIAALRGGMA